MSNYIVIIIYFVCIYFSIAQLPVWRYKQNILPRLQITKRFQCAHTRYFCPNESDVFTSFSSFFYGLTYPCTYP